MLFRLLAVAYVWDLAHGLAVWRPPDEGNKVSDDSGDESSGASGDESGGASDHAVYGKWGFNIEGMNKTISPGDNFYKYSDGKAVANLKIPSDRTSWGVFDTLAELSEKRTKQILEEAKENRMAKFYASFLDEDGHVEKLGAKPLQPLLKEIEDIQSMQDFARLAGRSNDGFFPSPFGLGIEPDDKNPDVYTVSVWQGGLGLPDRDYYLSKQYSQQKAAYKKHIVTVLNLVGWKDAQTAGDDILSLEEQIAEVSWSNSENRDPNARYNPMTAAELAKKAPGFAWTPFLTEIGPFPEDTRIIVNEPTAISNISSILKAADLATLRSWAAFHATVSAGSYLSKEFVDQMFEFYGKLLSGQQEQRPRWKRAVSSSNEVLGDAIGEVYVEMFFPPSSKTAVEKMCQELKEAFRRRLMKLDWMEESTRQSALKKLASFTIEVGYPTEFRKYEGFHPNATTLFKNMEQAIAADWSFDKGRLPKPVNKNEWGMSPQTVNAYNMPIFNMVVFPAAILQAPFFDPKADDAVNFGGIGSVIGHEMTHGFDDEGRKYNAKGQLHNWWTEKDVEEFDKRAGRYGKQFAEFVEGLPKDSHINPNLTMGEDIADLGGLTLAIEAYQIAKGKQNEKVTPPALVTTHPDLEGERRVLLGFAQLWTEKVKEEALQMQLAADPHPPANARVIMPTRNMDVWYDAFDIKPNTQFFLPQDDRVKIW